MNSTRAKVLGLLVATGVLAGAVTASGAQADAPRDALEQLVKQEKFPGAVLVTQSTSYTAGAARFGRPGPPPVNGRVRAASNTKTFVAVVVLQLVAEGKVELDAPIERYLPGLIRGKGIDGHKITVRNLVQQNSGLPEYTSHIGIDDYEKSKDRYFEPRQLLAVALAHPATAQPGQRWEYSNTNYIVAGMLIERMTGRPLAEQVTKRVIDKARLRDTYWPRVGERTIRGTHARGYGLLKDGKTVADVTELDPSAAWAAGQLITTPADLNAFFAALIGGKLLPARQLAEMRKTVPAQMWPGARYGLGLVSTELSCGGVYWGHGGDIPGFETRGGVTEDGRQASVVVTALPGTFGPANGDRAHAAVMSTVDKALCSGGKR
ncbi:serine hydrolase domain-containing protein [Kibdelosporangium phytohabitans]|uniref:Serine hydrolase n=1 Tax=Kibdelosporangium phytohabitans TaxID=860235 RepID=A0A0N9I7D7_9PSEU|nr:serine hydrolase domain-containing protein [Kibdelosporangium phytohabitans]ALG10819.1 serine hydrolase [Kibdelosporangium phytohabitans]MBE1461989.1 D-alanyl-D-alanine carboxypeptidase [Kibdelosporangium phytohabitans]